MGLEQNEFSPHYKMVPQAWMSDWIHRERTTSEPRVSLVFTANDIGRSLGISKRAVFDKAAAESWPCEKKPVRGGEAFFFDFKGLPPRVQAALVSHYPERFESAEAGASVPETALGYDPEALWEHFNAKSEAARERAREKHRILVQAMALHDAGSTLREAIRQAAQMNGISVSTVLNWYYGKGGKPGVRHFRRIDWLAALVDEYAGISTEAECHPKAWDWLCAHYLSRSRPSFEDSYRRLSETAKAHGWVIPSRWTLQRRVEREYTPETIAFLREGPAALRRFFPAQSRDKTCFAAGEAVNGDGLKFDKLWIKFEDEEVLNTATAWVWQDIYSGKIMAWRVGKTENTDIFRLSLYDLTATTVPSYAWVDNTRVAANKAMTGRHPHRRRFTDKGSDPMGVLLQLGIETHFTDPDQNVSNPGVKPVERAFGIGGIHGEVATHPLFKERGYSPSTAISVEEFRKVLAEEIARFNARLGRRGGICNGRSYDQVFADSFKESLVRKASEAQRRLLLLLPEVARAHRETGELALNAGRGPAGRNRYWNEQLTSYAGRELVVYYDPENLQQSINVYTLDGKWICEAQWLASVAFNDVATGREWNKQKRRHQKAKKAAAISRQRMDALELAQLYPSPEEPDTPPTRVLAPTFGKTGRKEIDARAEEERQVKQKAVGADEFVLRWHAQHRKEMLEKGLPAGCGPTGS